MGSKDDWNHSKPSNDSDYAASFLHPEVAGLLPVLYPGVFKNLAAYTKPRADLVAILGTGIPSGIIPGFQNYTGKVVADMLRLNLAIPATPREGQPGRSRGWRPGRVPERSSGHRRRRHHRAAGDRRSADPAGRQVVQAGRRDQPGRRRFVDDADAAMFPVPQHAARRIQRGLT